MICWWRVCLSKDIVVSSLIADVRGNQRNAKTRQKHDANRVRASLPRHLVRFCGLRQTSKTRFLSSSSALDCQRAISGRGARRSVLVAFVLTVYSTTETAAAQRARPAAPQQQKTKQAQAQANYVAGPPNPSRKTWVRGREVPHQVQVDQRQRNASSADYHR